MASVKGKGLGLDLVRLLRILVDPSALYIEPVHTTPAADRPQMKPPSHLVTQTLLTG